MLLLIFYDGTKVEIPDCEDVSHVSACLVCLDHLGSPIASFLDEDVLGYTLQPSIIRRFRAIPRDEISKRALNPYADGS
jgi:hypothetical protein